MGRGSTVSVRCQLDSPGVNTAGAKQTTQASTYAGTHQVFLHG